MSWVVSMENRSFVFRWNRGEEGVSRAERIGGIKEKIGAFNSRVGERRIG